jgi:hypothetical protein
MTDEEFMKLFDAKNVSPNLQQIRESDSEKEPVYFAGGYARSLADLQELNEAEPIGKQVGGRRRTRSNRIKAKSRRTRNRKAKKRQSTYHRRLSLQRQSTYHRRLSLQRQSTYHRRLSLQRQSTYRRR